MISISSGLDNLKKIRPTHFFGEYNPFADATVRIIDFSEKLRIFSDKLGIICVLCSIRNPNLSERTDIV